MTPAQEKSIALLQAYLNNTPDEEIRADLAKVKGGTGPTIKEYFEHLEALQTQCDHPYATVQSKCNGEINYCLKCGKHI